MNRHLKGNANFTCLHTESYGRIEKSGGVSVYAVLVVDKVTHHPQQIVHTQCSRVYCREDCRRGTCILSQTACKTIVLFI